VLWVVDITVAVALITAGSTLVGGLAASVTAISVQRRQIEGQKTLARLQLLEERETRRNDMRREIYIQVLNEFDKISDLLSKCWMEEPPAGHDEVVPESMIALDGGIQRFESAMNAVSIEGPTSVADMAQKAAQNFRDEFLTVLKLAERNIGRSDVLSSLANNEYSNAYQMRLVMKDELVVAIKSALAENAPVESSELRRAPVIRWGLRAPVGTR
jgi:hypothetical protein